MNIYVTSQFRSDFVIVSTTNIDREVFALMGVFLGVYLLAIIYVYLTAATAPDQENEKERREKKVT